MARARNIKPSFFKNDVLAELDPLARLLFIGLWTVADYKGCIEYRPKRLKIEILPYDDCDIEQLMINLERSGFISIYSVQGQQYAKVLKFAEHQNPHKNEKETGSDIPDITEAENRNSKNSLNNNELKDIEINRDKNGTNLDSNGSDRADSLLLIPDSLNPITDSLEAGNSSSSKPPKRKSQIPENLEPTKAMIQFALDKNFDYMTEFELFKNYHISEKTLSANWEANWRTWVLRGLKFLEERKARASPQKQKVQSLSEKDYSCGVKEDGTVEL